MLFVPALQPLLLLITATSGSRLDNRMPSSEMASDADLQPLSKTVPSPWDVGSHSGLVNIGSHNLWFHSQGPDRRPGDPVIIIVPGLASSITGWAAVQRKLTPFIRVYSYDRTGYGQSESSPESPTSTRIAHELDLLLKNARISPPYIIVAHSWGGILGREFLSLRRRKDIVGMVFVEANQENTLDVLDWRKVSDSPVLVGVDRAKVTGILQKQKLTEEEWDLYQATEAAEKHQKQGALEFAQYENSFATLKAKGQLQADPPLLGHYPVCVIRGDNGGDFKKLYEAGISMGNGNATDRAWFAEVLRTWDFKDRGLQKKHLRLSSTGHYFEVPGSGHNVQLTAPDKIVDGVQWVLAHLQKHR